MTQPPGMIPGTTLQSCTSADGKAGSRDPHCGNYRPQEHPPLLPSRDQEGSLQLLASESHLLCGTLLSNTSTKPVAGPLTSAWQEKSRICSHMAPPLFRSLSDHTQARLLGRTLSTSRSLKVRRSLPPKYRKTHQE